MRSQDWCEQYFSEINFAKQLAVLTGRKQLTHAKLTPFSTVKFMGHSGNPPKLWEIFTYSSLKFDPIPAAKCISDTCTNIPHPSQKYKWWWYLGSKINLKPLK